jgi:hypothetical protein
MRIGDVGAVSPAGDLLAFSLAVVIIAALVVKVGSAGDDKDDILGGPTISEVRSLHGWPGFDPDGDGTLDPYAKTGDLDPGSVLIDNFVVVRMEFSDDVVEHLFQKGSYGGMVENSIPISNVVGITSLFESRERVICGSFSCFFVEADR